MRTNAFHSLLALRGGEKYEKEKNMRRRHTTSGSNAYHEALAKASERVGTEEKAFRWLIRFSQLNLLGLSPGEWLDLQHEVAVFTKFGPQGRLRYAPLATPDWMTT